jgi:hypothetical protein
MALFAVHWQGLRRPWAVLLKLIGVPVAEAPHEPRGQSTVRMRDRRTALSDNSGSKDRVPPTGRRAPTLRLARSPWRRIYAW